ncbi:hypothetical protein LWI29_027355 [Acer saccharum]|uniref:Uncharacterized protein n=1 Tax=Acer saccharum TaxID=4024 RepID=A0AA39W445_ACESA|nr:hypothetical protein LWI29_027355 [Acer saccharum]
MEVVTKWDPVRLKASDEVRQIYSNIRHIDQQVSAVSMVAVLEADLEQARARIQELETDHRSSKNKRYMQDYDKERKARELIEEVCNELAKEIGEDKAEVEALKRESMKLWEEFEDERNMLQMAEVWLEERVQMKLVDARVAFENKYSQMNKLVEELETFLRSSSATPDGSSCSPEKSAPSIRNHRDSNVSRSGIEWEDNGYERTPITEMLTKPLKVSSIARLWRSGPTNGENNKIISVEGMKGGLSNGRLSNVSLMSPDRGSGKGDLSPPDLVGQWSSPKSGKPSHNPWHERVH